MGDYSHRRRWHTTKGARLRADRSGTFDGVGMIVSHMDARRAVRRQGGSVVALALFWAWTHLLVFVPSQWASHDISRGLTLASGISAMLVALIAVLALSRRHGSLFASRGFLCAVGAVSVVSGPLVYAQAGRPWLSLGALTTAYACNMLLIGVWATRYARMRSTGEQTMTTLSAMLLSFVVYAALVRLPHGLAGIAMAGVAFLFSLVMLVTTGMGATRDVRDGEAEGRLGALVGPDAPTGRVVWRPSLFVLGFILVFSIPPCYLQGAGWGLGNPHDDGAGYGLVFLLSFCVLAVVCLLEWSVARRGFSILSSATVLLLSAALLSSPFFSDDGSLVVQTCLIAGYFLFLSVTYLQLGHCVCLRHEGPVNAPAVFATGMIANELGLVLGMALERVALLSSSTFTSIATVAIIYGLLILGGALLPRKMKAILLGVRERQVTPESQNPYVADMVSSINAQCARVTACFGLTPREQVVLSYLVRGWSLQMIAEAEHLTRNTVKTHVTHIYQKLGVHTREEMSLLVERLDENASVAGDAGNMPGR